MAVGTEESNNHFRSQDEQVPQDWHRLAEWLGTRGRVLGQEPRQFATGLANLNYLVTVDDTPCVLRRPPAGPVAEGANDMAREFRVLRGLAPCFPLAPAALEFCDDPAVLGAPFQLLEFRQGAPLGPWLHALPDGPARVVDALVQVMVQLHEVDPEEAGLADLGRPAGFAHRQVEGWARRAQAAFGEALPPGAGSVIARLRAAIPTTDQSSLVHGDLKMDNLLFDPQTLQPVAVFDWDMATRGDSLFDLAVSLSYWVQPGDPVEVHGLGQSPALEPGFPSRADIAAAYLGRRDLRADDLPFFLLLARFRLAVVFRQLAVTHGAAEPRSETFANLSVALMQWAADSSLDL